ncbi:hypothetical protein BC830DRAFT_1107730 [Chytriomyces sp. MP71]|nr:hypothetical protein BC830DRAFT_1107730 [Chytriomyces sp. MP71]
MDCSAVTHGHVSCVQGLCNLGCTNPYVFRSNGGSGTTCVEPSRVAVGGGCVSSANCAAVSRGDVSCLGAVCVLACHAPYVEGGENMCVVSCKRWVASMSFAELYIIGTN